MAITSQTATVDAWVNQVLPNSNNGQSAALWLNGDSGGSAVKKAYIFFGRPFPSGATVTSATLNLYVHTGWAGAKTVTVKRVTTEWGENTLTYNTVPTVTTTHQATTAPSGPVTGQLVTLDLTTMLADVAAGGDWFGVEVTISGTTTVKFYASENSDQTMRPSLDVTWSLLPDAPVMLVPGGAQAVSVAKPVLAWQFDSHDHSAERTQASSQVQIGTSAANLLAGTTEYDSTMTANTISNWDLSATAYVGVSDGATRYWRVRVQDDQGNTSPWSDIVQFNRTNKGALTMSIPASGTPTVGETTPAITWALATRTQEAFELRLYSVVATVKTLLWRLPKITSAAVSYNLPAGYLHETDTFNIELLNWDTIDRATTPGDPPYTTINRDFTYVRDGTPAAVTALTATEIVDSEGNSTGMVQLDFTRSATPDFFAIKEDGKLVEGLDRLDPATLSLGGTSYRYIHTSSTPNAAHTYEVEAVVLS